MTNQRSHAQLARSPEFASQHRLAYRPVQNEILNNKRSLRILKFGGTSVADACCIGKVIELIRTASENGNVVVVVSAMSGVTNSLIDAATQSEAGNYESAAKVFAGIRELHAAAIDSLIRSPEERSRLAQKMNEFLQEGEHLCQGTMLLGELSPQIRDSISSLGERLSAPLVAAALSEHGIDSEAVDATALIVTDSDYGAANPWMDRTRERCELRLRPMLQRGIVPVVTGFIGATEDGKRTTLGRGGSDYSATILGAVLAADEVVIWTDVDGLLTADPRLVPGACTIREISYHEAAELAYFGARVLHPKTVLALMDCGIPLSIRNTFFPERPGTKITGTGHLNGTGARALAAISDAVLISFGQACMATAHDVLTRTCAATSSVHANVLMISQSSACNNVCLVVPSAQAKLTIEALRREFMQELPHQKSHHLILDRAVAMITVVGENISRVRGRVGRLFGALGRENINVLSIAQGLADCKTSFIVEREYLKATLTIIHRELQLGTANLDVVPVANPDRPALWYYEPQRPRADPD